MSCDHFGVVTGVFSTNNLINSSLSNCGLSGFNEATYTGVLDKLSTSCRPRVRLGSMAINWAITVNSKVHWAIISGNRALQNFSIKQLLNEVE